ncbi:Uncharacterized protein SCF082_LOCUS10326 [Durusdinium trenchii]|uniref:Calcineurin-like phosphoesterase domain-containing protein n=1 Tax=Durusdinium trenchii TaxID=1381693 RepID=A0ABP0J5Q8_9DINO
MHSAERCSVLGHRFGTVGRRESLDGPSQQRGSQHDREHVTETGGGPLAPPGRDLLTLRSRRWFLQTGMRGLGGLTLPGLLRAKAAQAGAAAPATPTEAPKAVIVFWLSGGISQIDSWDPKPNAPREIRGPFLPISTAVPGTSFCEHLPLQASIADKLSVLRAVDCRTSNHTPITLQAGNPLARRTNDGRDGGGYPSMGSVVSKFRGPNDPMMPAFVGLAKSWAADVYGAGHLGSAYDPVNGLELAGKFNLPKGIELDRLDDRNRLRRGFDRMRRDLDQGHTLERTDRFTQQAYGMVLSGRVQQAFNLDEETDETRDLYGRESVGEKAPAHVIAVMVEVPPGTAHKDICRAGFHESTAVAVFEQLDVDAVLHCGDIGSPDIVPLFIGRTTHFVLGNVDDASDFEHVIREAGLNYPGRFGDLELGGRRIALLHGDDGRRLQDAVAGQEYDLVCHGHTHLADVRNYDRTTVLNPGALFRAQTYSVAVVNLQTMEVEHHEIAKPGG